MHIAGGKVKIVVLARSHHKDPHEGQAHLFEQLAAKSNQKLLRNKSHTFGALLQIFVDISCSHRNFGSDVYNTIFTQYPLVGPSVTHKLIARSLQFLLTDRPTRLSGRLRRLHGQGEH